MSAGEIRKRHFKKARKKNHRTGRERTHFFGFEPPKKVSGVAPAYLTRAANCSLPHPPLAVTA
jgi:hypothetical protein